jgi:aspartyl-tRNA(Asn)/glutamyl-tRNA(Gln) amidotransferase subunit A
MTGPAGTPRSPSVEETVDLLASGQLLAPEIVGHALVRAHECRARVGAFSEIDDTGATRAALDSGSRHAKGSARQLEGVPVVVKDLIDTRGLATRYGSAAYEGHVPSEDAAAVGALRGKGAIVIGKTTTHEFAWGVTTASTRFGDTLNPRDRTRVPGGSSGGTAAAIAFGAVAAGLGTDTGGSVRIPAALCGVTGFKPSFGRLSTAGVFPLAPSLDHVGVMGRTVDDVTRVAAALGIASAAPADPGRLRIGVISELGGVPAEAAVSAAFGIAVGRLGPICDVRVISDTSLFDGSFDTFAGIVLAEGGIAHFSRNDRDFIHKAYEPETVARLKLAESVLLGDYARQQEARRLLQRRVSALMEEFDFLVLPTCPCVAPPIGSDRIAIGGWSGSVRMALMINTAPFNLTGMPAVSVPAGTGALGLPMGLQIVGRAGEDERLLTAAARFEKLLSGSGHPSEP